MRTLLVILLGAIVFALVISPLVFEVGDNALIQAGAAFDGDPPPCRADRVGVVLTLKGQPSVCQQTPNGYQWTPAAQPARVAPVAPAVRPAQALPGPDVCSNPPGKVGQVTQSDYYTLADGRGVKAICTADGWKAVTK